MKLMPFSDSSLRYLFKMNPFQSQCLPSLCPTQQTATRTHNTQPDTGHRTRSVRDRLHRSADMNTLMFIVVVVGVFVVEVTAESRERRADDGGPLEVVVQHLSQQVTSLTAQLNSAVTELTELKGRTGELTLYWTLIIYDMFALR